MSNFGYYLAPLTFIALVLLKAFGFITLSWIAILVIAIIVELL